MNPLQTILVFVGIPLAIYAVLGLLTLVPGRRSRRAAAGLSGDGWDHPAQWLAGDTPIEIPSADSYVGSSRGGASGGW